MTTQIQTGSDSQVTLCDAKDVEAFLKQNPDFFLEHPQLLGDLEIPHVSGGAVSLIERQVAVLRQENKQYRNRIKELVDIAKENEALIGRLHVLSVALIKTDNAAQFISELSDRLMEDFSAFDVSVKLYDNVFKTPVESENFIDRKDPALANFEKFIGHTNPVCGRFSAEQLNYLFPEKAADIKSMALVPLISDEDLGFFAIASDDSERFKAGMSTSFLSSLSEIAAVTLSRFK